MSGGPAARPVLWTSTRTSGTVSHMAAAVSGLDVEIRFISLRAGDHRRPDYLAVNPKGEVPALQLPDGTVVTETPAILFWLGDSAPGSGLLPSGRTARAQALEWIAWCHFRMANSFSMAFLAKRFAGGDEVAAEAVRAAATARSREALAFADGRLRATPGGTLLGTAEPAAPDLFLAMLGTFGDLLRIDTTDLHALAALRGRVAAMPGVAAALQREREAG